MKKLDPFEDPTSIGNLAISESHLNEEQLELALSKQEQKQLLGEVFVLHRFVTRKQLDALLRLQRVLRTRGGTPVTKLALKRQRRKTKELIKSLKTTTDAMRLFMAGQKS